MDTAQQPQQQPQQEPQQQPQQQQQQQQQQERIETNQGSGALFFSAIPRTRRAKGQTPVETTLAHMDRTPQLEEMIAHEYGGCEMYILGELQIAYIAFILGQNY